MHILWMKWASFPFMDAKLWMKWASFPLHGCKVMDEMGILPPSWMQSYAKIRCSPTTQKMWFRVASFGTG